MQALSAASRPVFWISRRSRSMSFTALRVRWRWRLFPPRQEAPQGHIDATMVEAPRVAGRDAELFGDLRLYLAGGLEMDAFQREQDRIATEIQASHRPR